MSIKLQDREEVEHQKHLAENRTGAHFCPEWDFMAIHDDMPEAEACLCNLDHLKERSNG